MHTNLISRYDILFHSKADKITYLKDIAVASDKNIQTDMVRRFLNIQQN